MAKKKQELAVTQELRKFKHAPPSSPLCIKTIGGHILTVDHPDFMIISPRGDAAVVYAREEVGHRALDLRQVVSVETVPRGRRTGRR